MFSFRTSADSSLSYITNSYSTSSAFKNLKSTKSYCGSMFCDHLIVCITVMN